jgi:hypothetical protein
LEVDPLTSNFKSAALAVTQLFKEAQKEKAKGFHAGYIQCLEDLFSFLGILPDEYDPPMSSSNDARSSSLPSSSSTTHPLNMASLHAFVRSKLDIFQSAPHLIDAMSTAGCLDKGSISSDGSMNPHNPAASSSSSSINPRSLTSPQSPDSLNNQSIASPPPTDIIPASTASQLPPIFTFSATIPDTISLIQRPANHYQQQLRRHRIFGESGNHHQRTSSASPFLDALNGLGLGTSTLSHNHASDSTSLTPSSHPSVHQPSNTSIFGPTSQFNDGNNVGMAELVNPGESLKRRWVAAPEQISPAAGATPEDHRRTYSTAVAGNSGMGSTEMLSPYGFGHHLQGPDFKRARWRKEKDEDMDG